MGAMTKRERHRRVATKGPDVHGPPARDWRESQFKDSDDLETEVGVPQAAPPSAPVPGSLPGAASAAKVDTAVGTLGEPGRGSHDGKRGSRVGPAAYNAAGPS